MGGRSITGTAVGLGTAALLGVGGAGCPTPPATGQPEPAEAGVTQDATVPEPTPPAADAAVEPTPPAADAVVEPTPPEPVVADAGPPPDLGGPGAQDPCEGPEQFTERCGYPSPARYAVLHPGRIRNG